MGIAEQALRHGGTTVLAVTVEGIPWVFTERRARTVTGDAPTVPAGYESALDALVIGEADTVSVELDRETGVAAGKAWDVRLSLDVLAAANVAASIFGRPTVRQLLTADVDHADTEIECEDPGAFSDGDRLFLGRETLEVDGTPGATLPVTRAVVSQAWSYRATSPSTYGVITDRPSVWRGRLVRLWEHVASPEGRLYGDAWATAGDYCRLIWSGYVDEAPRPDAVGMRLRVMPLHRLAAQDVGYEFSADAYPVTSTALGLPAGGMPIRVTALDRLTFYVYQTAGGSADYTVTAPAYDDTFTSAVMTLRQWAELVADTLNTAIGGAAWLDGPTPVRTTVDAATWATADDVVLWFVQCASGSEVAVNWSKVSPVACPWLRDPFYGGASSSMAPVGVGRLSQETMRRFLVVANVDGEGYRDETVPTEGMGIVQAGEWNWQAVRWTAADAVTDPTSSFVVLTLEDPVRADLMFADGLRLEAGVVVDNEPGAAALTLLTSSGTGTHGPYDELPVGTGYGLPTDLVADTDVWTGLNLGAAAVATFAVSGRASLEAMVGGWLALTGWCVAMRRGVVEPVYVYPVGDPGATVVDGSHVLLEQVDVPAVIDPPNEVVVNVGFSPVGDDPSGRVIVRDVPRIQGEGTRRVEVKAPGASVTVAAELGGYWISRSEGMTTVRVRIPPWVDLEVGDQVNLALGHPLIYDWATMDRGAASVSGVVVAVERMLATGARSVVVLYDAQGAVRRYLAPTATVASVAGSTITLGAGEGAWFTAGQKLAVYKPGNEATRLDQCTVASVVGDAVTLTSAPPAWVASGTLVTYPTLADADTVQDDRAFSGVNTRWA